MKKKLVSILLIFCLLLSACGQQPAPTESAAQPSESTAAQTPAVTVADPAGTTAFGN